jgi:uncharacterized membrane protein
MPMKTFSIAYVATGLTFLAIDAVWLTLSADRLYRANIGHLLADRFHLAPAAAFYLVYIAGIVVFAVSPALQSGRWSTALVQGLALGFVAYATYDLTNQATLRDWPLAVTLADLAWGTVLTGVAASAGFFAVRLLVPID